jgi:hypothetical protein
MNVTGLKSELQAMIHGTTLNQVVNMNGLIYRAARQLLLDLDPQEMKRISPLASAIYDSVYDYPIPVDVKGNKVIDIRPQVSRNLSDNFLQTYGKPFDLTKTSLVDQFTVNFNSGLKTIRIADSGLVPGVVLSNADSITSNGTWTTGGTASNLTADNVNHVSGSASLKFDLGIGTGYLENSTINSQNLSAWINQAVQFLYTYMQTASGISSVELRWGSSSANYYKQTTIVTQQNTAFQNGWNLLSLPWLNATVVGSPDSTKITYLRISWVATSVQTGMRLDNIMTSLGTILEMVYYSSYLFKDAVTGAWQETITDDSNVINLATESYNLLIYQCGIHLAQQLQGLDAMFYDGNYFLQHYMDALGRYRNQFKSEIQKPINTYYAMRKPGFGKYVSWRNPQ